MNDDDKKTREMMAGLDGLPPGVRARIDEFTKKLESALGDDLVGILVHGSVVRGDYRPGESDVDVVVILEQAHFAHLEVIGEAMQLARYSARIEAMILIESEIAAGSAAFPLVYEEIKRRHITLSGRDSFASIEVPDGHRRLRIEQELRDAQIRLRRVVTDACGAREAIGGAVARKLKQVRAPLHALLALKGIACAPGLSAVLNQLEQIYAIDLAPLRAAPESPDGAHATLVALLSKTIDDVHAMGIAPRR